MKNFIILIERSVFMLEVKKVGKTQYGNWVLGILKYNGLEIQDVFSVNKELSENEVYKPQKISIYRNKKGNLKIKIDL